MPTYRTGPDLSLDDLVAQIDTNGERIVQVIPRQGKDSFLIITQAPRNDTGNAWLPSFAKETR